MLSILKKSYKKSDPRFSPPGFSDKRTNEVQEGALAKLVFWCCHQIYDSAFNIVFPVPRIYIFI